MGEKSTPLHTVQQTHTDCITRTTKFVENSLTDCGESLTARDGDVFLMRAVVLLPWIVVAGGERTLLASAVDRVQPDRIVAGTETVANDHADSSGMHRQHNYLAAPTVTAKIGFCVSFSKVKSHICKSRGNA